jgi:hypothetical protein
VDVHQADVPAALLDGGNVRRVEVGNVSECHLQQPRIVTSATNLRAELPLEAGRGGAGLSGALTNALEGKGPLAESAG